MKVGVVGWLTETVIVGEPVEHWPAVDVNVYVVVAVLFTAGNQVPVIGVVLVDEVGKVNVAPEQIAEIWENDGVTGWLTVTVCDAVLAQTPVVGVNV